MPHLLSHSQSPFWSDLVCSAYGALTADVLTKIKWLAELFLGLPPELGHVYRDLLLLHNCYESLSPKKAILSTTDAMGNEETCEENANNKEPQDFVCSSQFGAQRQ